MAAKAAVCCEHCEHMDEFTVECRPSIADVIAKEAEQSITWANNFFKIPCPHTGHAAIGKNWYEIH